jgi:hypothetical protein
MMVSDATNIGAIMPTIPLYASLDTEPVARQRTFAVDRATRFEGFGQTRGGRGSGHHQGGHFGPPALSYRNQEMFGLGQEVFGLGQTTGGRGSGHHQGGHFGPPALAYRNQQMFGLGQTRGGRGSGHHQGGRFGPPALAYRNQQMFGLGRGSMMPGAEGASQSSESLFGFGEDLEGDDSSSLF